MYYLIKHKTQPNFLLAICSSKSSAEKWISEFDPKMWMDKTMTVDDLHIVVSDTAWA